MASESSIRRIRRTAEKDLEGQTVYDDGFLRVEHTNYYVSIDGQPIHLPLKEFLLLSRLVCKAERVIPIRNLWELVWGSEKSIDEPTMRVHLSRLRHKLMPFGIGIESMPGVGYRLTLAKRAKT